MFEIISKLYDFYVLLFEELPDPRTKSLFLAAKPYQPLTILIIYILFVFNFGPRWMKNRKPFDMRKVLIAYNAIQVFACAFLSINGLMIWCQKFRWVCEPVDVSDSDDARFIVRLFYSYYLLKIFDLIDTIFFVLRKKFNQVTFLHVYHHCGMVALIWGAVTYFPGGHGMFIGVVNTFVHVIMYSYYFLTVLVPKNQVSGWKKHITQLQILQFMIMIIHMSTIVFKSDCQYPRWSAALFLPQNIFILTLFVDFYIKTYVKREKSVDESQFLDEFKGKEKVEDLRKNNNYKFETSIRNRKEEWRVKSNGNTRL